MRGGSHCTSAKGEPKKRWATEKAARFVAEYASLVKRKPHRHYHCPTCGKWHTTTTMRAKSG